MTVYTFPRVRVQQKRQGYCPVCGRLATRTQWFERRFTHIKLTRAQEREVEARMEARQASIHSLPKEGDRG